jgi:hypothetical protein
VLAILRYLVVGPGVMAFRFGQFDCADPFCRVVPPHARDCGSQEAADGFQPIPLRGGRPDSDKHALDMLASQ